MKTITQDEGAGEYIRRAAVAEASMVPFCDAGIGMQGKNAAQPG